MWYEHVISLHRENLLNYYYKMNQLFENVTYTCFDQDEYNSENPRLKIIFS